MQDINEVARVALDKSASFVDREAAFSRIADLNPLMAQKILLRIASDWDEQEDVLRAAGRQLGVLGTAVGYLSEFDCRDITEAAYAEYDKWLAF